MNNSQLYIIGNGFDLHHGIQSSYDNFRTYLKHEDSSLFDAVETYLSLEDNWSDLEASLASLDVDYLTDNASNFLVSYGAEDWSDAYHHDYQYEIEQVVESLSSKLKENFTNWIKQLGIPNKNEVTGKLLDINPNAMYLTFNYTKTLKKLYDVKKSNTLFIHGNAKKEQSDLILGHAWNPDEIKPLSEEEDYERLDVRVIEGNEIINCYFHKTFKQTSKIIEDNANYFNNLKTVSHIYVLGHSLSDVDIEYFEAIITHTDSNKVNWTVSYYNTEEMKKHQQTMNKLGVHKNIKFVQLNDLIKQESK
jgi:hypothetical protein